MQAITAPASHKLHSTAPVEMPCKKDGKPVQGRGISADAPVRLGGAEIVVPHRMVQHAGHKQSVAPPLQVVASTSVDRNPRVQCTVPGEDHQALLFSRSVNVARDQSSLPYQSSPETNPTVCAKGYTAYSRVTRTETGEWTREAKFHTLPAASPALQTIDLNGAQQQPAAAGGTLPLLSGRSSAASSGVPTIPCLPHCLRICLCLRALPMVLWGIRW